jgi:hypothetical protein
MPKHTTMWLLAGGSALTSAALTYAVTRPSVAPITGRLRAGGAWVSRKVADVRGRQSGRVGLRCAPAAEEPPRNRAFEAHRETTLARLAEDERAFQNFLDQLRHANDRAEFDRFMADRRDRPQTTGGTPATRPA